MAHMDIFSENGAFTLSELTHALDGNLPYQPTLLRSMGLFEFRSISQPNFEIEMKDGKLDLIPFSDPDAAPTAGSTEGTERNIRQFKTRHFSKDRTIRASEVSGIRAFGSETEFQQVQDLVTARALELRNEAELTFEFHMMNAVQGLVKNTTGATVYNFFTEFGITPASEIDFNLDDAGAAKGALSRKCQETVQQIEDSMGGLVATDSLEPLVLCGTAFWNDLIYNKEVRDAYEAVSGSLSLDYTRNPQRGEFAWGGFRWRRYRGGSGVSIGTDKCVIFPTNVNGMFLQLASPAQDFQTVNTPGRETYFRTITDDVRQRWVKVEMEANPMFVCTRPQALRSGRRT